VQGVLQNTELGHELIERHNLILLDPTELSSHDSVKHLIEVDETIVDLDPHLEDDALDIRRACGIIKFHIHQHARREPLEKAVDILDLEALALVAARVVAPRLFKTIEVFLEA